MEQVEYKTEKGTMLFVKVSDKFTIRNVSTVNPMRSWIYGVDENNKEHYINVPVDFKLIGLTNEVTEEQSKNMFNGLSTAQLDGVYYSTGKGERYCYETALNAFKSLMQHLQVYEVNPYSNPVLGDTAEMWPFGLPKELEDEYFKWQEAEARTGKWVVLFKPN